MNSANNHDSDRFGSENTMGAVATPTQAPTDDRPPYFHVSQIPRSATGLDYELKMRVGNAIAGQLAGVLKGLTDREFNLVSTFIVIDGTPYTDFDIACGDAAGMAIKAAMLVITGEDGDPFDGVLLTPIHEWREQLVADISTENPSHHRYESLLYLIEICDGFQFSTGRREAMSIGARLENVGLKQESARWGTWVAELPEKPSAPPPSRHDQRSRDFHYSALSHREKARRSLIDAATVDIAAANTAKLPRLRRLYFLSAANSYMEAHSWSDALRACSDGLAVEGHYDDTQDLIETSQEIGRRMNFEHRKRLTDAIEARIDSISPNGGA